MSLGRRAALLKKITEGMHSITLSEVDLWDISNHISAYHNKPYTKDLILRTGKGEGYFEALSPLIHRVVFEIEINEEFYVHLFTSRGVGISGCSYTTIFKEYFGNLVELFGAWNFFEALVARLPE